MMNIHLFWTVSKDLLYKAAISLQIFPLCVLTNGLRLNRPFIDFLANLFSIFFLISLDFSILFSRLSISELISTDDLTYSLKLYLNALPDQKQIQEKWEKKREENRGGGHERRC